MPVANPHTANSSLFPVRLPRTDRLVPVQLSRDARNMVTPGIR